MLHDLLLWLFYNDYREILLGENGTGSSILCAPNESYFSASHSGVYTTKNICVGHLFLATYTKIVVMVAYENFLMCE